jgi:selenide,water dikinase
MNPWPMIGGVANSVCHKDEIIRPNYGKVGDLLLLTKPLGTQAAVNAKQWMSGNTIEYENLKSSLTDDDIDLAYDLAMESMARLNKNGASLMKKYEVGGCTDITGFGLLGHLENLAEA